MYDMNENEYEPVSLDSDIFLSEVPIALIQENIKSQFEEPLENKNNYMKIFIDKYRISKELCEEDNMPLLIQTRDDFMLFITGLFEEYLSVSIVDFEDLSEEDQDDTVLMIYEFFIMNIKKNFVHLILNYIDKYRKSLSDISVKKKDVTTLSFKREVTNVNDLNILANLSDIVDHIFEVELSIEDFFKLTKQCLETDLMDTAYDEFKVTGNFVELYRNLIDTEYKREIESKVRSKILKKYKKEQ